MADIPLVPLETWLLACVAVLSPLSAIADETAAPYMHEKAALFDRIVAEALQDQALTYQGANAFLNVALFGKVLQDTSFGRRSCQDEPSARGANDTREEHAKAAAEHARKIAERVASSTTELPDRPGFPRGAAASFARVLRALRDSGDPDAIAGALESPELALFLLDPAEAGYCRLVAAQGEEARFARAGELERSGIRRLELAANDESHSMLLHLYRPNRVLSNLGKAAGTLPIPGETETRGRLADYASRLAPLKGSVREPREQLEPFTFPKKNPPASVLDDPRNRLSSDQKYPLRMNMPIELAALRRQLAAGERRPSFSEEQWRALRLITESCAKLRDAPDFFLLRVVTEPGATNGRYVWALGDERAVGVSVHLALLDRLARHDPKKRLRELHRELDFYCSAIAEGK